MNESSYLFNTHNNSLRFDFISVGVRIIRKSILYTETELPKVYSLALVDIFEDGTADDQSVSNNGDMEKILATVYQTLVLFFKQYPYAVVAFTGSTPSRTRLYRIALANQLQSLILLYNVWGIVNNNIEPFRKNQPYTNFLFSLKMTNIV